MKETADQKHTARNDDQWRLRAYIVAFIASVMLYLAMHGAGSTLLLFMTAVAMIIAGMLQLKGFLLQTGIFLALLLTVVDPAVVDAIGQDKSLASVWTATQIWPQLLVALMASRALACEREVSFRKFWADPLGERSAVGTQSVGSALALGVFFTLLFYAIVPGLSTGLPQAPSSIIVSAMLGRTIIHSLIIFLFFAILAFIIEAAWQYRADRIVLNRVREFFRKTPQWSSDAPNGLADEFPEFMHRRVIRLLNGAFELAQVHDADKSQLATLSFDSFHRASRQFIRTLIPFLTLLGFLGTVIGLATAVSELPTDLATGQGGFDISASLAGLAVKFETTLLGLIASMISSLLLNLLERQEAQLAAECLLIVHEERASHA